MSFRSNSMLHTPLRTFVSQRTRFVRRSYLTTTSNTSSHRDSNNDIFSAQTRALQQTQVSQAATSNPTFSRRRCRIPPPQHALGHCTSCQTPHTNSPCQSVSKKHWVAGKERAPGGGFVPRLEAGDGNITLPWVPCARGYQLLQYCAKQRADAAYAIYAKIK
jgi:hypothetical protein